LKSYSKAQKEMVINLAKEGMTDQDIAAVTGIPKGTLCKWLVCLIGQRYEIRNDSKKPKPTGENVAGPPHARGYANWH
jgi:hypothetical protein